MFGIIKSSSKKAKNDQIINKLNEVSDIIPSADVLSFFNKLTDAYKEAKVTEREITLIQAQKEVLLKEIEEKYDLYHKVFDRIFDERQSAINKSFDIIDEGLKNNDNNLVSIGMQGLSKVVSSSPFSNVEQLSNMLEGNRIIEI